MKYLNSIQIVFKKNMFEFVLPRPFLTKRFPCLVHESPFSACAMQEN